MANTIASRVYRDKYRKAVFEEILRRALIAVKIFDVDKSNSKRIQNPYSSEPTVTVQALAGTYSVADFTTTDQALDVTDEVIIAEHIHDFQEMLTNFSLFADRTQKQAFKVAEAIDKYAINVLTDEAGESYSTPAGGFAKDNIDVIFSNLLAKVAGYAETYKGLFLVIESTEVPGLVQKQIASGFSYADTALQNGFLTSYMGIDIYVTRPNLFIDGTMGTRTFTNSGHRVFGVKGVATYAQPGDIRFEEKEVSGKTGVEVVSYAYVGAKVWSPIANLIVDITLTPSS